MYAYAIKSACFISLMVASFFIHTLPCHAADSILLDKQSITTQNAQDLPQWQKILHSKPQENMASTIQKNNEWNEFVNSIRSEPPLRQMMRINIWFNKLPYKLDNWIYKQDDYWATPVELLSNGGDCEDFAIAKYMTLRKLGFSPSVLKIAMVYDIYSGTDHAFLVVRQEGVDYILDNREKLTVARFLKNRYEPHYAFNEESLWIFEPPKVVRTIRKDQNQSVLPGNR